MTVVQLIKLTEAEIRGIEIRLIEMRGYLEGLLFAKKCHTDIKASKPCGD